MRGGEPFFLPGGERGALLIHGFTGAPAEMRLVGERLAGQGYTVLAPRLAGHCTSPADMNRTGWRHWYGDVEDGYHLLKGMCREIMVAGLSMGGLLAFKLAAEYPVTKIAAVSAPIFIFDKRLLFLPFYRLFRSFEPQQRRRLEVNDQYNVSYDVVPLASLASLLAFIKQVDGLLPRLKQPVLLIQSRADRTVKPESAPHILRRLGSREKRLVWLERSGHVATLDVEYEQVLAEIAGFFAAKSNI